jgi:hypothetical protein
VNVRDVGASDRVTELAPIAPENFGSPSGAGSRCCFITTAARELATGGRAYLITVAAGSDEPPTEALVSELNELLATFSSEPHAAPLLPLPGTERIAGYGLTMRLPQGWQGNVRSGDFRAEGNDIELRLVERGGTDAIFAAGRPPRLWPSEFVRGESAPAATGRFLQLNGRRFLLSVESGSMPPSAEALAETNAALASLAIEAGDFYPGAVAPATFAAADGWTTGTGGAAEVEPGGYGTFTWASTAPYLDTPGSLPPRETLERLPPDGIVITVWLWTPVAEFRRLPDRILLADAEVQGDWVRDLPLHRIMATRPGEYNADVWIFFGRVEPTESQLARAQAELDRLRLPDWSS